MSKARITYRFNNEIQERLPERDSNHRDRIDGVAPSKVIPLYQEDPDFTNRDYGVWRSPFDAETERIEQLIRNSKTRKDVEEPDVDQETPSFYTAPQADQSFQHVNFYDELPVRTTYRKRGKNTNWFSLTTSITGAILTGIVLGMFVLSMFRGEVNPFPNANEQSTADNGLSAVQNESGEATLDVVKDESLTNGMANNSASASTVIVPEQTYFLIQNGVFSTLEGANTAVQLLKDMSLSGAVSHADQFSVFAGAAVDREDALLISHYLQNEKLEVFIKPYILPAVQQVTWAGEEGNQIQGYMEKSRSLVKLILGMTSIGLQDINNTALAASDKQLVQQEHKLWTEAANQLAADAAEDVIALVQQMNKSLNSAVLTLEQYDKNPTEVYLWQAQAAVSEHIIAQKQFIDATIMK
jgi:stage II sporulation protein B